jgi:hypothetical protein
MQVFGHGKKPAPGRRRKKGVNGSAMKVARYALRGKGVPGAYYGAYGGVQREPLRAMRTRAQR